MKTSRNLIFLAALVVVMTASTPMAAAQTYLGEFCWGYSEDPPPGTRGIGVGVDPLPAAVTHVGGAYYLFQGRVGSLFLEATGVIVGDELWLNGSTAQDFAPGFPERSSGSWQARLNLSTLSGTFWRILSNVVILDGVHPSYTQGYITGNLEFRGACS